MKRLGRLLMTLFMATFVFSLTACGGGGDGEGFTPITYTGATTPASVNASNAADLTALAYTGSDLGGVVPLSLTSGTATPVGPPATYLQSLAKMIRTLPSYVTNLSATPGASAAAMTVPAETMACMSGGSMTLSGSVDNNGTATLNISFSTCNDGGTIMSGSLSMSLSSTMLDVEGFPDTNPPANLTANMTFKNLSMVDPGTGENMTVYGTVAMAINQSGANPITDMTLNMVMREASSGLAAKIENYHIMVTDYFTYEQITISARVYDSVQGYVDITTLTPFVDDGVSLYPTSGVLRLDGANLSWAEVDFSFTPPQGTWDDGQGGSGPFTL